MEKRKARVIIAKAGGNASKNSYNAKISLPKKWIDAMGITPDDREVILTFDNGAITVEKEVTNGKE